MAKIIAVVIFGFILAGPYFADAECAWVLWSTAYAIGPGGKPLSETTMPDDAYITKEECDRSLGRRDSREDQRRKKDPTRERYFTCLPDTVDPRGPKGK